MPQLSHPVWDLLGVASIKGRARGVYYVLRDGVLTRLPSSCRAKE